MNDLTPRSRKGQRSRARAARSPRSPRRLLTVDVVLDGARPLIRRELVVTSTLTLAELHLVLQAAFEWEHSHLHAFDNGVRRWQPADEIAASLRFGASPEAEERTRLAEVLGQPGDELEYVYDFGDSWTHLLRTTDVGELPDSADPARLRAAEGAAPFEDCGGIYGWSEVVEVLTCPGGEHAAERRAWAEDTYGNLDGFDPTFADVTALDRRVRAAIRR